MFLKRLLYFSPDGADGGGAGEATMADAGGDITGTWTSSSAGKESVLTGKTIGESENNDFLKDDFKARKDEQEKEKDLEKDKDKPSKDEKKPDKPVSEKDPAEMTKKEFDEYKAKVEAYFKDPRVQKALSTIESQQQNQQQQAPAQPQTWDDVFKDVDEAAILDKGPKAFMKTLMEKIAPMFGQEMNRIATQLRNEFGQTVNPIIEKASMEKANNIVGEFENKYVKNENLSESDRKLNSKFMQEGTKEYAALVNELQANPSLGIEKAFRIVRADFAESLVNGKVEKLAERKRNMSLPDDGTNRATARVGKIKNAYDAFNQAWQQNVEN
jgi:hypothetical protein